MRAGLFSTKGFGNPTGLLQRQVAFQAIGCTGLLPDQYVPLYQTFHSVFPFLSLSRFGSSAQTAGKPFTVAPWTTRGCTFSNV